MTQDATASRRDARRGRGSVIRVLAVTPWYPALLALVWFVQIYHVSHVEAPAAARSLVVCLGMALVVTAVSVRCLGTYRGSLSAALVLMGMIAVSDAMVAVLVLAGVLLLTIDHHRMQASALRRAWPWIHEALSIGVTVLILVTVATGLMYADPAPLLDSQAWSQQPLNTAARPDVFMILVDAHGRQDVLQDLYAYDDHPFLLSLQGLGFQVATHSRANYGRTRFSLASMLTASYLTPLNAMPDPARQDALARTTISQNPAFSMLRRDGYRVIVVSGGYEHLGLRSADRYLDTGQPNEFEDALIGNVGVARLVDAAWPAVRGGALRDRTRDDLALVARLAGEASDAPRFVLVHVPAPHGPYVFDADCRPSTLVIDPPAGIGLGGNPTTVAAVAAQTACVDTLLEASLASLVERDPSAVVIVFSDHGPDEHLNWAAPDRAGLNERSATLFAARTPGTQGAFPDDISLIDVLPDLFNTYLGTRLNLQPNEFWFGPRPGDNAFIRVDLQ